MTDECSITHSRTKHDAASQQTSKKGTRVTAPSFLRKSFYMISNCDHSLADWSDDGTTFVIKAPELFASKILPSYFKHSNLSSFVRQLNFYGFRKIKADPLRLHEAALSEASRFLKFGHLFFVQGREDLLLQIKKEKDKNDKSTGADIVHTRKVNQELKRKISVLAKDIEDLKATHGEMVLSIEDVNNIQRNVEPPCTATTILLPGDASSFNPGSRVQPLMALPDTFETTDWLEAPPEEDAIVSRYDSSESATATIHSTPYTTTHTAPYDRTISPPARDLQQALFRLPLGVQAQLVDRLVHEIQSPRDTQGQIDEPTPRSGATTKRLHAINHSETVGDGNSKKIALLGSNHLDLFLLRESKSLFDTMQPVEPDNGLRHVDNMSNGDFSSP